MKKDSRSNYVFGAALAAVAISGAPALMNQAHGALVTNAAFTFESITAAGGLFSSTGSITGAAGSLFGAYGADSGTGTAYGMHTGTSQYSAPGGNGSVKSFSSNNWAVGDYYQFSVPTTGIMGIQVSFDEIGSASGPSQFNLLYSADGSTFSTLTGYVVSSILGTNSAPSSFWGAVSSQSFYNHSFDLSAITGLDNDGSAVFRIQDSASAPGFASSIVATGGTDRVDNFVVSGTAVPEPASLSLLTMAAAGLMLRRRSEV